MDWGAFVIIAAIMTNGQVTTYQPSTLFDREACIKQATQINTEWRAQGLHGFASCKLVES
jgi:hypothetical protein